VRRTADNLNHDDRNDHDDNEFQHDNHDNDDKYSDDDYEYDYDSDHNCAACKLRPVLPDGLHPAATSRSRLWRHPIPELHRDLYGA